MREIKESLKGKVWRSNSSQNLTDLATFFCVDDLDLALPIIGRFCSRSSPVFSAIASMVGLWALSHDLIGDVAVKSMLADLELRELWLAFKDTFDRLPSTLFFQDGHRRGKVATVESLGATSNFARSVKTPSFRNYANKFLVLTLTLVLCTEIFHLKPTLWFFAVFDSLFSTLDFESSTHQLD